MTGSQPARERDVLQEAFLAGWQAALAVEITHPRVLAVVDSCFEMWLEEAGDESELFGLVFRGREDLPLPTRRTAARPGPVARTQPSPTAPPQVARGPQPGRLAARWRPRHAT